MKWVVMVVGALAALVIIIVVIGALLPREHKASSSIVLQQPVHTVWKTIRDMAGATGWWPGLTLSERLPDVAGRERWYQRGGGFEMTAEIIEDVPPTRMTTLIVSKPGDPYGGRWIYELASVPGGTRVTVTEDGWVANVIFRFMSRFVMGPYATIDNYLAALARKFGENVPPRHAT